MSDRTRLENETAQSTRYWLTETGHAAAEQAQAAIDAGDLEPLT